MISRATIAILALSMVCVATGSQDRIEREADVVRAASLVRHFHPHDAAGAVDWNAVLLEGFDLAAAGTDDAIFAAELERLLAPLGTGITRNVDSQYRLDCKQDEAVRWVHIGFDADWAHSNGVYMSRRANLPPDSLDDQAESVAFKSLPAGDWMGKRLRFSAEMRAPGIGEATLWVRLLDGQGSILGSWEQAIDAREWSPVAVEFEVTGQARRLLLGMKSRAGATAEFTAQKLEESDEQGSWHTSEPPLPDPGLWQSQSPGNYHEMKTRSEADRRVTRLVPFDPSGYLPDDPPASFALELIDGSTLHIPLALCPGEIDLGKSAREALDTRFPTTDTGELSAAELARLDVAAFWPLMDHYYPYRQVMDAWPETLHTALSQAGKVESREDIERVLQTLAFPLHDGHIRIQDQQDTTERALLPLAFERIDGKLVVSTSAVENIQPGDVLVAVDGMPVEDWWAQRERTRSGSPQWREHRMRLDIVIGQKNSERELTLAREGKQLSRTLTHERSRPVERFDYPPIHQPAENVYYIDLTAIDDERLNEVIPKLAAADGVIIDVRGYPRQSFNWISHLLDGDENWRDWMVVMAARAPGGDLVPGTRHGWRLEPAEPHIDVPVMFLTDESAISYAESVLGLVQYHELGTLIGRPTAGANGNLNTIVLPSGFVMSYTGMYVIGPDGEPIHATGIEPDIRVDPDLESVTTGRDEMLERALAEIERAY